MARDSETASITVISDDFVISLGSSQPPLPASGHLRRRRPQPQPLDLSAGPFCDGSSRGQVGQEGTSASMRKAPLPVLECQAMKSVVFRAALVFALGLAASAASAQT